MEEQVLVKLTCAKLITLSIDKSSPNNDDYISQDIDVVHHLTALESWFVSALTSALQSLLVPWRL